MASSRGVGEPLQCIRLLSNVSYDIEHIYFFRKFQGFSEIFNFSPLFCLYLAYSQSTQVKINFIKDTN